MELKASYLNLSLISIPLFVLIGKVIFRDLAGFFESIRLMITPDLLSAIRGELYDDWWESLRFLFFILICALLVIAEKSLIDQFFGA